MRNHTVWRPINIFLSEISCLPGFLTFDLIDDVKQALTTTTITTNAITVEPLEPKYLQLLSLTAIRHWQTHDLCDPKSSLWNWQSQCNFSYQWEVTKKLSTLKCPCMQNTNLCNYKCSRSICHKHKHTQYEIPFIFGKKSKTTMYDPFFQLTISLYQYCLEMFAGLANAKHTIIMCG